MTDFERAREIALRYIEARIDQYKLGNPRGSEFDIDEFSAVSEYVWNKFTDEEWVILHAYTSFQTEYALGKRCSMCGNTPAQNEAIGYNCAEKC